MLGIVTLCVSFTPHFYHSLSKAFPFLLSPSPSLPQGTERILFSLAWFSPPLYSAKLLTGTTAVLYLLLVSSNNAERPDKIRCNFKGSRDKALLLLTPPLSPTVIPPQPAVTDSQASAGEHGKRHLTGQKHDLHQFQASQTCCA